VHVLNEPPTRSPWTPRAVRDVLYAVSAVSFYKLSLIMVVFHCLWVFLLVLSILGGAWQMMLATSPNAV